MSDDVPKAATPAETFAALAAVLAQLTRLVERLTDRADAQSLETRALGQLVVELWRELEGR